MDSISFKGLPVNKVKGITPQILNTKTSTFIDMNFALRAQTAKPKHGNIYVTQPIVKKPITEAEQKAEELKQKALKLSLSADAIVSKLQEIFKLAEKDVNSALVEFYDYLNLVNLKITNRFKTVKTLYGKTNKYAKEKIETLITPKKRVSFILDRQDNILVQEIQDTKTGKSIFFCEDHAQKTSLEFQKAEEPDFKGHIKVFKDGKEHASAELLDEQNLLFDIPDIK